MRWIAVVWLAKIESKSNYLQKIHRNRSKLKRTIVTALDCTSKLIRRGDGQTSRKWLNFVGALGQQAVYYCIFMVAYVCTLVTFVCCCRWSATGLLLWTMWKVQCSCNGVAWSKSWGLVWSLRAKILSQNCAHDRYSIGKFSSLWGGRLMPNIWDLQKRYLIGFEICCEWFKSCWAKDL